MMKPTWDKLYSHSRWRALRARQLDKAPLCVMCQADGRTTQAKVVDHIVPHKGDMALMWNTDNLQSLCTSHHNSTKQRTEGNQFAASFHPEWLKPSAIPLTIVSGPPASGKSTYVQDNADPNDIIIDLDGIMRSLNPAYTHWTGELDKALLSRAIRQRNQMLADLSRARHGKAWFIVSAPSQLERRWWHNKLGGALILLDPGRDECKRRATDRGTPNAIAGIDRWFKASGEAWQPREKKREPVAVGLDGWPA